MLVPSDDSCDDRLNPIKPGYFGEARQSSSKLKTTTYAGVIKQAGLDTADGSADDRDTWRGGT